ncbi:hypothetical protein, conserved [Trypanosoma brucei brucei TREU927]|uniref:Nodulin-like domain-containing protein n=1 Tax=Trypanosoma brucei brucei (strain 927/4 GUTat10.1) TaxID=185431 RepID=Q580F8_TRYB2|nr:hypothetical protein, conserved [Trypanosoma brucei brucei TREU927]AAX79771.1 hypothetical protein, conserved [Trypanosoma brucei]AAZ12933.1 hypothetical protein, conserved [Trypanosoma brucei brucei TREU927]
MNCAADHVVERLPTARQQPAGEPHRFGLLAVAAFSCICVSLTYGFNLISGAMQERYGLTQRDLSTISTVGIAVGYFGLPYSFIYDHFGPKPIYFLGLLCYLLGTVMFALTFQGVIEGTVLRLSIYNASVTLGCSMFDMGALVTLLSVFPSNRGAVVAMLKTLNGLGAAIVGSVRLAFFSENTSAYFYFLMTLVIVIGTLATAYVRLPSYHLTGYEENHLSEEEKVKRLMRKAVYLRQKAPTWRFVHGFVILIALIVFLPTQGALLAYLKLGSDYKVGFAVVTIILTLLLPLMAIPTTKFDGNNQRIGIDDKSPTEGAVGSNDGDSSGSNVVETNVDYIAPQFQESFLAGLRTLRLWCLMFTIFFCAGSLFVVMFNARYIYTAMVGEAPDEALNTLLTVLGGAGSATGRLGMSFFEVWSQKRKPEQRVPITVVLFIPTTFVIIMLTMFLTVPKSVLPLSYFIGALANGCNSATIILVSRTIFAKDPAKHYYFCYIGSLLSAIFLNRLLYGEWYTHEAEKRGEVVCTDKVCVMMPMMLLLVLSLLAFVSSSYVHVQYRRLCTKALEERRRIREEEAAARRQLSGATATAELPN